jgi:hypothetical protein
MAEPATRSVTVRVTSTSSGLAVACMRTTKLNSSINPSVATTPG